MQEVKNFENIVVPGPRTIKKPKYHYMVVGGLLVQLRGVPGGGQLPPQYSGISAVKHVLAPPGGQSLFSTCPPNIFLADTPLVQRHRRHPRELPGQCYVNLSIW